MKKETLEKIIKASNCVANDATRPHLECVLVDSTHVVATDGHKMCILKHDDKEIFSKEYLVSPEDIFLLKIILKTYSKYADEMIHSIGENSITINGTNKFSSVTIKTADSLGLTYPNYKQFLPSAIKERVKIAFNVKYLSQIFEALKNNETKCKGVTLEIEVKRNKKDEMIGIDHLSPFVIRQDSDDLAVLMPMRPQL